MANVLVIDDDRMICDILCHFIQSIGHDASYVLRLKEGINKISSESYDLVILDVRLPDGNGLEAIPEIKASFSSPEVIIITGEGSVEGARLAVESGSWDYIQKPLSVETVKLSLVRAIQYREEKSVSKAPLVLNREAIIGESNSIKKCIDLIAGVMETDISVLITGETGTGKELFARAIHSNSRRNKKDFVVVDCASLPDNLVESTIFGHRKGAFTGAEKNKDGLISAADGGTLFLDEVGELPLSVQASFLRVLQERHFRPVGGSQEIHSNFRLIAATNRNLDQMASEGTFRSDLLFRIKSFVINVPPLRERSKDIIEIAHHYIRKFCNQYHIDSKGVSTEFVESLLSYEWPGNVRELVNSIERAISVASDDHTLYPIHLPIDIRSKLICDTIGPQNLPPKASVNKTEAYPDFPSLKQLNESTEKKYFEDLVNFTGGNISEICRLSGVSRANVYIRLKKYNIPRRS